MAAEVARPSSKGAEFSSRKPRPPHSNSVNSGLVHLSEVPSTDELVELLRATRQSTADLSPATPRRASSDGSHPTSTGCSFQRSSSSGGARVTAASGGFAAGSGGAAGGATAGAGSSAAAGSVLDGPEALRSRLLQELERRASATPPGSLDGWLGAGAYMLLRHERQAAPAAAAPAAAARGSQPRIKEEEEAQEARGGPAAACTTPGGSAGEAGGASAAEPQSSPVPSAGTGLACLRTDAAPDGDAGSGRRPLSPSPRSPAHPCTFLSPPPQLAPEPAPISAAGGSGAFGVAGAWLRTHSTSISTTAASTAGSTTPASSYVSISSFAASDSASTSAPRPVGLLSTHDGRNSCDSAPATANGLRHGANRGGNGGAYDPSHLAEKDEAAAAWVGMRNSEASPSAPQQQQQQKRPWLQQDQERGPGADGMEAAAASAGPGSGFGSGPGTSTGVVLDSTSRRHRSMSCTGSSRHGGAGSSLCNGFGMMGSGGVRASRSRASIAGSDGSSSSSMLMMAGASPQQQLELEQRKQQRRISQTVVASGPVPPLLALRQVLSGKNLAAAGGGAAPLICQRDPSQSGGGIAGAAEVNAGAGGAGASRQSLSRTSSRRSGSGDAGYKTPGLALLSPGRVSPSLPISPSFKHTAQSPPVHPAFALASPTPSPPLSPPPERADASSAPPPSAAAPLPPQAPVIMRQAADSGAAGEALLDDAVVITAVISPASTASGAAFSGVPGGAAAVSRFGADAEKAARRVQESVVDVCASSAPAVSSSPGVEAAAPPEPQLQVSPPPAPPPPPPQQQQQAQTRGGSVGCGAADGSLAQRSPPLDTSPKSFGRISSPISASVGGRVSLDDDAYIAAVLGNCSLGGGSPSDGGGGSGGDVSAPLLTAPLAPHPILPPLQPPIRHGSYCTASAAAAAAAASAYGSLMAETGAGGCGSSSDGGAGAAAATATTGFHAAGGGNGAGRQSHMAPQRFASSGVSAFASAAAQRQQLLPRQPVFDQPARRAGGSSGNAIAGSGIDGIGGGAALSAGKAPGSESPFACLCCSPLVLEGDEPADQAAAAGAAAVCEACARSGKDRSSHSHGSSRLSGGANRGGSGVGSATSSVTGPRGAKERRPASKLRVSAAAGEQIPAAAAAVATAAVATAVDMASAPGDVPEPIEDSMPAAPTCLSSLASTSVADCAEGADCITAAIADARSGSGCSGSGSLAAAGRSASESEAAAASVSALMMGDVLWPRAVRYSGAMSIGGSRSSSIGLAPGLSLSMGMGCSNASDAAADYLDAAIAAATGDGGAGGSAFSTTSASAAAAAAMAAAASATGGAASPISHLHRSPRYLWGVSPDDTTLMRALGDGGLGPCAHLTIWSSSRLGSRMGSLLPASSLAGGLGGGSGSLYGSMAGASALPSFANGCVSRGSTSGSPVTMGGFGGGGGAVELDFALPQPAREGPLAGSAVVGSGGSAGSAAGGAAAVSEARPRSAGGRQRRSQGSTPTACQPQPQAPGKPPMPPKQASPSASDAPVVASLRRSAVAGAMGGLAPPRQVRWQQSLACVAGGHSASEAEGEEEEARTAAAVAPASSSTRATCAGGGDLAAALATASVSQLLAALVSRMAGEVLAAPARLAAAFLALLLSWLALAVAGSKVAVGMALHRTAGMLSDLHVTVPARLLAATGRALAGGPGAGTGGVDAAGGAANEGASRATAGMDVSGRGGVSDD
ncbi:hypothetical protein HXX76_015913 [Chlamydomonas incerta]|uniref:Uncharacterized protein n=1 Tax=Chlamydomonas incerta TaxID=51695 RepID=A0A835SLG8_CHLIN|nr:hypothetical protein HXX76_015913 [Chlamydomonas incerta]|eukprot:KAG2422585.1 hypothetical protein HXX76_015913 [Chlamydomonas incerta]